METTNIVSFSNNISNILRIFQNLNTFSIISIECLYQYFQMEKRDSDARESTVYYNAAIQYTITASSQKINQTKYKDNQ